MGQRLTDEEFLQGYDANQKWILECLETGDRDALLWTFEVSSHTAADAKVETGLYAIDWSSRRRTAEAIAELGYLGTLIET